jgi:two-component system sensor histidine kinase UhpB
MFDTLESNRPRISEVSEMSCVTNWLPDLSTILPADGATRHRKARRTEEHLGQDNAQVQELAGRLIAAQEDERARIARELHDDFSQRLAALSLGLSALKQHVDGDDGRNELSRLQRGAIRLAAEMRSLSHELHPGILRHAGLAVALRSHCRELDSRNGPAVTFAGDPSDLPGLPPEVAICFYRVAQEGLRNVVRHAGARRAEVILRACPKALRLTVSDDGCGFDAVTARASAGVGLGSMAERVRRVHGSISIASHPGRGTDLHVAIPLHFLAPSPTRTMEYV